ncbi:MAG: DUF4012 domain-containing protein [Candidatus Woykebacteria bacterium]
MGISELNIEGDKVAKKSKHTLLKRLAIIFGVLFVLILGAASYVGLYVVPNVKAFQVSIEGSYEKAKKIQKAAEAEDIPKVKEEATNLKESLNELKNNLEKFSFARFVPIAGGYYNDANHLLVAGVAAAEAGEIAADGILPFSDVLGLKGHKTKTTAKEKTQFIVKKVVPSLVPLLGELEGKINVIDEELNQVNPDRYPASFKIKEFSVRQGLTDAKGNVHHVRNFLPDIKLIVNTLPSILGEPKEKTYLVLFQNDKEIRATGGFITAYAVAKVRAGELVDIESDDIYKLDRKFSPKEAPPEPLRKYLILKIFPIRDSNLSPDFKTSAEKFESFYKTIPAVSKVDGILALDTEFVRAFMEITGPIKVEKLGDTFSAKNNEYGISDVVYKLELYAETVFKGSSERKSFIGDLMDALIDKVLNAKPEQFEPLFNTFLEQANEKHILFYFHDESAQKIVEKFNFAGRIKDYDGDYLHVNNSNFAGLKANLFITQTIEQDIITSSDGTITKKVKVTLNNPNNKLLGWLNSYYRNWMRVYVPKNSKLINKEVQTDFKESADLDKKVFEGFTVTPPLGNSVTIFTYELPFKIKPGDEYKMLLQRQPGMDATKMIIRLNGKEVEKFNLLNDKEIKIKL